MGHHITALLLARPFDEEAARRYDLQAVALTPELVMFHIDHYFTAYWNAVHERASGQPLVGLESPKGLPGIFPREGILLHMARELRGEEHPHFAVVMTEYFGGVGDQWAVVYRGEARQSADQASINDALVSFGVQRKGGLDEFDTVGLGRHRSSPDYLERYVDLCDELGV